MRIDSNAMHGRARARRPLAEEGAAACRLPSRLACLEQRAQSAMRHSGMPPPPESSTEAINTAPRSSASSATGGGGSGGGLAEAKAIKADLRALGLSAKGSKKELAARLAAARESSTGLAQSGGAVGKEANATSSSGGRSSTSVPPELYEPLQPPTSTSPRDGQQHSSSSRCNCSVTSSVTVVAVLVNTAVLIWMNFLKKSPATAPAAASPATGGNGTPGSSGGGDSLAGMVHCAVRGNDACWLSVNCTNAWQPTQAQEPKWNPNAPSLEACSASNGNLPNATRYGA